MDFGTNRKRKRNDFLLVRHSNRVPYLHRFGYIAGFCALAHDPYSTLILGVFPLIVPDRPSWGQPEHKP